MALLDYFSLFMNALLFSLCVAKLWRTVKAKSQSQEMEDSQDSLESSFDGSQLTFSHLLEKERENDTIHTSQNNIVIVCVTGGPCAGKSSVIAKIMSLARTHDIQVYYQPDVNNTVRNGGFTLPLSQMTDTQKISYVSVLIKLQMKLENIFFSLAQTSQKKALILVERGTLDYKPLLSKELWQGLLDENGWKEVSLSNTRYHMVIHLETAARGAAEIFNKWNDGVWTISSAMEMDLQLKEVWKNHHHFRALRNMKGLRDFENKVDESVKDILTFVNPSSYRQHKRKFLVECDDPGSWGLEDFGKDSIETMVLKPANADQSGTEKVEMMTERSGDTFYIQKISINPDPTSSQKITAV